MTNDLWLFFGFLLVGMAMVLHITAPHHLPPEAQPKAEPPTVEFTLHDLMMVESAGNPDARSPAGACGLYQIMQPTWEDMTDRPYSMCTDPDINEQVAVKYLRWLDTTLTRWMGEEPTASDILSAWNGGIGRFRAMKFDPVSMPTETQEFVIKVLSN